MFKNQTGSGVNQVIEENNSTVAGIIQASLIHNALSRCSAMSMSEGTMDGASGMTVGYGEYFGGILFMTVEVQLWQLMLLFCMMICIGVWVIHEIRGYNASLASWSALTDDLMQDEWNNKKDAFISYMRWKRQQEERSSWVPMTIRSWFLGNRDDIDRAPGAGECASFAQSIGTQTALLDTVELPPIRRYSDDAPMETESEKARRYQHQRLDESSDVEFWMSLHHHEGSEEDPASPMQVDSEAPPDQATQEAALEDYAATVERARRVFWDRQDEFLQAGDYDGLDRFNSQYSWLDYV